MSNSVSAVYTVYQGFSQFYTTNKSYFLLPEIISLLYVLLGLSYLTNSYLMRKQIDIKVFVTLLLACVQKLVKNYGFSARLDGMLVSICVAFPQFFTNLIACLSSKPGMFGFGLGSIIGSGVYGKYSSLIVLMLILSSRFGCMHWYRFNIFFRLPPDRYYI